ncbi:MAG: hypothetical protein ACRYG8_03465 [Janthinobacterium lividum]
MDADEHASWSIVFSEFEGARWDDQTGEWKKPGAGGEGGDA